MAKTTASRKQKGRLLQQSVRDSILKAFPSLTERDVRSAPMGTTGEDVVLSEEASKLFPYAIECKNQEKINIWAAVEQSEQRRKDNMIPLVVFKRNRSNIYCVLKFSDLLKLL